MKFATPIIAALCGLLPAQGFATVLNFPANATQIVAQSEPLGNANIAISRFSDATAYTRSVEGQVITEAWKFPFASQSTLQIITPLRQQLLEDGFEIVLDCKDESCGGFDFRYGIDILPEPEMHIDLGDFRYLSVKKTDADGAKEFISLIVSRSASTGFVQLTRIGAATKDQGSIVASTKSTTFTGAPVTFDGTGLAGSLETVGRAPLEDLTFGTGSSSLGDSSFVSLDELADYLKSNPEKTVALVGHTDSEGSLSGNINLSRKRATSVLERLVSSYGIPRRQLEADGVGYLSPRASNLTEDGRTQNRRVEVILTSTQ